jgi:hypothetical protein
MLPEVPSAPDASDMDPERYEHAREAYERSREAMERSHEALQHMQEQMMRDTGMKHMERQMRRSRIVLERNRGAMDSARVMLDRNRGALDSASGLLERDRENRVFKRKESFRFRIVDPGNGIRNRKSGSIVIDKDGGDIELEDAPDGARVSTGGGAIIVGHSRGVVSAETGGGDIELGPTEGAADASTGSGNVSINLVGEGAHPVNIVSGTGDVELILPKDADATLDLETAYTKNFKKHSQIKSDWKLDVTETTDWDDSHGTPRKFVRVRQNVGKGGPLIRIRTVNGDIRIKQGS